MRMPAYDVRPAFLCNKPGKPTLHVDNIYTMSNPQPQTQSQSTHIVVQAVKNFISKLRQSPDIYPIRYYKKSRRFRRHWHGPMVK